MILSIPDQLLHYLLADLPVRVLAPGVNEPDGVNNLNGIVLLVVIAIHVELVRSDLIGRRVQLPERLFFLADGLSTH